MGILGLSLVLVSVIIYFTISRLTDTKKYYKGYNKGWEDCCKSYNNFEMSPDDELVLYIMKKALRASFNFSFETVIECFFPYLSSQDSK